MKSRVAIRRCAEYRTEIVQAAVVEAMRAAVDLPALVAGKKVLIKINLLNDAPPAKAVCTHPEVTRAVIRACRAAGAAEIIVGEQPGMQLSENPEQAFEASGNADVCRQEKARMAPFSRHGFREVEVPGAQKLRSLMVANLILDTEVVVNVPKLKSHIQALYTGAIKNWFGTVASRDRKRSHHLTKLEPFSESLVDIFRVRPPALTVMDGIVGMEGRGPGEGNPRQLGLVLASTDAVALDTVALHCVDYAQMNVPHVRIAAEQGLGTADLAQIAIDGPAINEVRVPFELPPRSFSSPPAFVMRLALKMYWIRPLILTEQCQLCEACAKMCPVGAITMGEKAAMINRSICIECFCCHEACPHNAIGEYASIAYRLARWAERRKLIR